MEQDDNNSIVSERSPNSDSASINLTVGLIEELDDDEYDIPPIETPPTLESILYESANAIVSGDESGTEDGSFPDAALFQETADSASIASTSSLDSKGQRYERKQRKSPMHDTQSSVLRHMVLRGISAQLSSASERVNAGTPTSMAVSSMIAVGTSHGIVLVFDLKQALKWCLGGSSTWDQYGAVSSLGFNQDCTRLLCGFAKGPITMWDITSGKILRTIVDAHPLGTAVLHIQFTDEPTLAICGDSGGSVFELNFKRVMGVRSCDSRCIFSGSRGEVCSSQVLNMIHLKGHPLQEVCIVALATLSKVIVITIRPFVKVLFTHPLKADSTTLPILSWQFVVIQVSPTERVIDPVLTFGRDNTIYFYQVSASAKDKIQFVPLQKMELTYTCLNFLWLNPRTIVILDTTERLHVVDVRTQDEAEVLDLAEVQLVYGSSHFKGLATGGNVSRALALAGERACYQSLATYQGQLLLLGTKSVHATALRTWSERIELLLKQNKLVEALALCLSFYQDKAKAVSVKSKRKEKKAVIAVKAVDLLFMLVDHTMNTLPSGTNVEATEEHFLDSIPLCIDCCVLLDRTDLLFDKLYDTFSSDAVGRGVFLEALEPHILGNVLTLIRPSVLQDFVQHYERRQLFDVLENCLLHLNVETLDLHQVVTLCRNHSMYDAIIYIFTRGLHDYVTPFQELMAILQKEIRPGKLLTNDIIKLGNKLLVYTSCCLAARAYPVGNISDDKKEMVKVEIFRCLTLLHTRNAPDDEPPYPYLRTFLHFDTRELLNVMSLSFEEPDFSKDGGSFQMQRLVDILLQIMVDGEGFTPSQVGSLFTFLARQMAKQNNTIVVNRALFEQVLEYLTNSDDDSRHAERQQALMELLNAGGFQHYEEDKLLELCDRIGFFQICKMMYEKRREYFRIVSCYLRDASRKMDVFSFVESNLLNMEHTENERKALVEEVISRIEEIVRINNRKTAKLIMHFFPERIMEIVGHLEGNSSIVYFLLQGFHQFRDDGENGGLADCVVLNPTLQELYVQLMCQIEPHDVIDYVTSSDNYRVEPILKIVNEYKIKDAIAFLLEKMGDVHGAFKILSENFQDCLNQLCDDVKGLSSPSEDRFTALENNLNVVMRFCQRNSIKVDEAEREGLWFPLLETLLTHQRKLGVKLTPKVQSTFKELTHRLLNSMMGYIKLPSILQKIIEDPTYQSSEFGEMKELLMGMLEAYNYEMTLLNATRNLVNNDLHLQLSRLRRMTSKGFTSGEDVCNSCGGNLTTALDGDVLVVFRCGHSFHGRCLKSMGVSERVSQCDWLCIHCAHSESRQSQDRVQRIDNPVTVAPLLASPGKGIRIESGGSKGKSIHVHLEPEQLRAIENLNRTVYAPSKYNSFKDLQEVSPRRQDSGSNVLQSHARHSLRLFPSRDQQIDLQDDY